MFLKALPRMTAKRRIRIAQLPYDSRYVVTDRWRKVRMDLQNHLVCCLTQKRLEISEGALKLLTPKWG